MRGISERLFLVTGAARGIGEAIARRLLEEGGRVIICDINEEGQTTADSLKKSGGEVHFRQLDVTDPSHVTSLAETILRDFGPVYGLVNNAGIAITHAAFDCPDERGRRDDRRARDSPRSYAARPG